MKGSYNNMEGHSVGSGAIARAVDRRDWSFLSRYLTVEMCFEHPFHMKQDWLISLLSNATEEQETLIWSAAKVAAQSECPHGFNTILTLLEDKLSIVLEDDNSPRVGEMIDLIGDQKVYGSARPYNRSKALDAINLQGVSRIPSVLFHMIRFDTIDFSLMNLEMYINSPSLLIRESAISVGSYFTRSDLEDEDIIPYRYRIAKIIENGLQDDHWLVRKTAQDSYFLSDGRV